MLFLQSRLERQHLKASPSCKLSSLSLDFAHSTQDSKQQGLEQTGYASRYFLSCPQPREDRGVMK